MSDPYDSQTTSPEDGPLLQLNSKGLLTASLEVRIGSIAVRSFDLSGQCP